MKRRALILIGLTSIAVTAGAGGFLSIKEVPFTSVHLNDNFWSPRIEINRTVSIPSALKQCEENGRFDNFAIAAGIKKGEHRGDFPFDDTDIYKVIEGASYSLSIKYDMNLDAYLDSVVALIAGAQESDGYLTTCVTNKCYRLSGWWGTHKWEKINSHELYNCGHLYEAAVAHFRATGKRTLLNVAIKNANLVCQVFGPNAGQKHVPSGHPIVEMALCKLYQVTGDKKYLETAKYFIQETGRGTDGHHLSQYSQDHKPILQQDEIVGHAVRAGYLYSGVADVASLTRDTAYFKALKRIWTNMVGKKLYITGGMGSRAEGEGFGPNYELNNHTAYCETCASIANVYWNYRMFLATGEAKYMDVVERALYNGVIAGVSLSGDKFFYDNPLESMGEHERQKWFGCACCPGNVTRFMASVSNYQYATQNDDVFVNLYIQGVANIKTQTDSLTIRQTSGFPWSGAVQLVVTPQKSQPFAIRLRIPGWALTSPVPSDLYRFTDAPRPYRITVNGKQTDARMENGYAVIDRVWNSGDEIEFSLPMDIRRIKANEKVTADQGKIALQRGPIVYCLEGKDQADGTVFDQVITAEEAIDTVYHANLLNGIVALNGKDFTAIPYYAWNNRGADQMEVWIADSKEYACAAPSPTIASKAQAYTLHQAPIQKDAAIKAIDTMEPAWGVNDQWEPKSSSDISEPYFYWWLKEGTPESLVYKFDKEYKVSNVQVYWLDFDQYDGNFRVPQRWTLSYKDRHGQWKEVKALNGYGTKKDCYNSLSFKPVVTTELKITAHLQKGESGGIIEWKVK